MAPVAQPAKDLGKGFKLAGGEVAVLPIGGGEVGEDALHLQALQGQHALDFGHGALHGAAHDAQPVHAGVELDMAAHRHAGVAGGL